MLKKVILSTIAIAGAGTALWFLYKRSSSKEKEELGLEPQPPSSEDEAQELVEQRNIAVQRETKPSVKRMIEFIERNNTGMEESNFCRREVAIPSLSREATIRHWSSRLEEWYSTLTPRQYTRSSTPHTPNSHRQRSSSVHTQGSPPLGGRPGRGSSSGCSEKTASSPDSGAVGR